MCEKIKYFWATGKERQKGSTGRCEHEGEQDKKRKKKGTRWARRRAPNKQEAPHLVNIVVLCARCPCLSFCFSLLLLWLGCLPNSFWAACSFIFLLFLLKRQFLPFGTLIKVHFRTCLYLSGCCFSFILCFPSCSSMFSLFLCFCLLFAEFSWFLISSLCPCGFVFFVFVLGFVDSLFLCSCFFCCRSSLCSFFLFGSCSSSCCVFSCFSCCCYFHSSWISQFLLFFLCSCFGVLSGFFPLLLLIVFFRLAITRRKQDVVRNVVSL